MIMMRMAALARVTRDRAREEGGGGLDRTRAATHSQRHERT